MRESQAHIAPKHTSYRCPTMNVPSGAPPTSSHFSRNVPLGAPPTYSHLFHLTGAMQCLKGVAVTVDATLLRCCGESCQTAQLNCIKFALVRNS